jgi:hypothetical protein
MTLPERFWEDDHNEVVCHGREGCDETLGFYNPKLSAQPTMICEECAASFTFEADDSEKQ